MKPIQILPLLTILSFAAIANGHADITVLHHWKLGEDDTGNTETVDSVGTLAVPLSGSPATVASSVPTSSLARDFTNVAGPWPTAATWFGNDVSTSVVPSDPTNWGFECWVNLDSLPAGGLDSEVTFVHIGDHGAGSAILQVVLGNYYIHLPGVGLADSGISAAEDIGTWVHFALVNEMQFTIDEGQEPPVITPTTPLTRLFRNGVEIATNGNGFNGGSGAVSIGAQHLNGIGGVQHARGTDGQIDDVRVFEFALGGFDPETDLLYPNGPSAGLRDIAITNFKIEGNGDLTLTWDSNDGETYSVWESTDLTLWLENLETVNSEGTETETTITPLNSNADNLFVRVRK